MANTLAARAASALYGSKAPQSGGTISAAVTSYVERRAARFNSRDDADNARRARQEGARISAWAERFKIRPSDLQTMLGKQLEWENRYEHRRMLESMGKEKPLTPEELQAQSFTRGATTGDALRVEFGEDEWSRRHSRFQAMATSLQQALPELYERASVSGASADLDIVRTLSAYEPAAPAKE